MTLREYLNLTGQDPDEDAVDDDTYRMEILDRLLEYAPNLCVRPETPPASPLPSAGGPRREGRPHTKNPDDTSNNAGPGRSNAPGPA